MMTLQELEMLRKQSEIMREIEWRNKQFRDWKNAKLEHQKLKPNAIRLIMNWKHKKAK